MTGESRPTSLDHTTHDIISQYMRPVNCRHHNCENIDSPLPSPTIDSPLPSPTTDFRHHHYEELPQHNAMQHMEVSENPANPTRGQCCNPGRKMFIFITTFLIFLVFLGTIGAVFIPRYLSQASGKYI